MPKFDLDDDVLPEDHAKKFMIDLKLINVEYEDVICILFPYTLKGKASTWLFNLFLISITSWQQFEVIFMARFINEEKSRILFLEILGLRINKKEKVKHFNQIFITLLNRIPDNPTEEVQIEFYTIALLPPIAMFVKNKEKKTLEDNFVEVINV